MEWMTWSEIGVLVVYQIGHFIIYIFTSLIFIYILLKTLSPRIKISPYISKQNINGTEVFIFKVVNMSRFNAYNVKFSLAKRTPYILDGKVNHRLETVKLRKHKLFSIPHYKKGEGFGDYAALIGTTLDISQNIGVDNLDYELSVSVCHGLSNLTKVDRKRFKNSGVIYTNPFKFGKSLDIIP